LFLARSPPPPRVWMVKDVYLLATKRRKIVYNEKMLEKNV